MAEIQRMSLANENTLETEHFVPLDQFLRYATFYVILKAFFERQN